MMWLLKQFNADDVEIVSDEFLKTRAELHETLRQIDNGEVGSMSMEEFEKLT